MDIVQKGQLQVAKVLADFIEQEVLPGTDVHLEGFWQGFEKLIADLAPINQALLEKRDQLQQQIDQWHRTHAGSLHDDAAYKAFLETIGYLLPPPRDFKITTSHVDAEIKDIAGPQLVVPVNNARYALNAANARWGSLFNALYGTDVIEEVPGYERDITYNPSRGSKVFEFVNRLLDQAIPLKNASHSDVCGYRLIENTEGSKQFVCMMADDQSTDLLHPEQFKGYLLSEGNLSALLFCHNGLHLELRFDPSVSACQRHPAGLCDVILESAVTSIQDCEDSVAAVDADDKVGVYRNWLGLMKGTLTARFNKGYRHLERAMQPDREYSSPQGDTFTLPGRSLMLVRNVGHLMTTDAILTANSEEIPEGIMDAVITSLIAIHDLKRGKQGNSRTGSVYIVKPKMHGPEEVAFTVELFSRVEALLGLPARTLKIGIMDEERRTSVNLKACIAEASDRIIFINTGFLDRTGDEIHTSMLAGPMQRKEAMKQQPWIKAYERHNVDVGLATGLAGHGQIGKGMWPKPDSMFDMMDEKISQPLAGANCAWVPSPTAATLHAVHYHQVDVREQQMRLAHRQPANIDDMLKIPLLTEEISSVDLQNEIDNNVQSILGYVVRWIDHGIGCSKVPDIHNIGLMEDRATLRISSQHLANWLQHGICSEQDVMTSLKNMAAKVDQQNQHDKQYYPMTNDLENSLAFNTAFDLIFKGMQQPNGYTEPLLHKRRKQAKALHQAMMDESNHVAHL
jgi:malate synthase